LVEEKTLGDQIVRNRPATSRGKIFIPGDQVYPWGPGVKLRMALWKGDYWLKKKQIIINWLINNWLIIDLKKDYILI
jgi:hypothetical protein